MTIAFQNAGTKTFASGAFSNPSTVTLPTSISSGDFLLMQISADGIITDTLACTGWTQVTRSSCSSPDGQTQYLFYRVADGTEGSTASVSGQVSFSSGVMTWVGRFTGVNTSTPLDATTVGSNRSTSDNSPSAVSMTGITTATNNAMVVALCSIDWNTGATSGAAMAWDSPMSEIADANNNNWVHYTNATQTKATAGATGALTGTATKSGAASGWCGHVVALKPAATAAALQMATSAAATLSATLTGGGLEGAWAAGATLSPNLSTGIQLAATPSAGASFSGTLGSIGPSLIQRVAFGALSPGQGLSASAFTFQFPQPTLWGNCLLLIVDNTSARTISSITDDGGNTWSSTPAVATTNGTMRSSIFVLPNVNGGTRQITVHFSASESCCHFLLAEYTEVDTSSPVGVTASSSTGTAPSISTGAISPTAGSRLFHYAWQNPNTVGNAGTTVVTSWTAASGWEIEAADYASGNGSTTQNMQAYGLQTRIANSGSITPTLTTSGTNTYNTLALELKYQANAGSRPDRGIRVLRQSFYTNTNINDATWTEPFPTSGNLIVATDIAGIMQAAPSDNQSNTWALPVTGVVNDVVSMAYAKNTSPSRAMTIGFPMTGRSTNHNTTVCVYDIVDADTTSPYVQSATAGPTSETGNFQHQPDITPSNANGLMIVACAIGIGPLTGITSPVPAHFMCVTYAGETDFDTFNNADGYGLYYYSTNLSAQNWSWGFGGTAQSAYSTAGEFKTGITPPGLQTGLIAGSSFSASLTTAIPLAAAWSAGAAVAGGLTTAIQAAAALSAGASVSGTLTSTGAVLQTALAAGSSLNAALTVGARFSVLIAAGQSLAGSLTTGVQAAAALSAGASLAGDLTTGIEVAMSMASAATLTAHLLTPSQFETEMAADTAITADLTTAIQLDLVLIVGSAFQASLTIPPAHAPTVVPFPSYVSNPPADGVIEWPYYYPFI